MTAASTTEKVLLDAEAISRTLSRIAHEIIEANLELDERRADRDPHARRPARAAAAAADRRARGRGGPARLARHHLLPRRRPGARRRGAAARTAARPRDEPRLSARGHDLRPRRRRALHRPDDPGRDRGALRLRPSRRASSSPASSTAATASSRSDRTTSARTCRPRAASGSRCSCSRSTRSTRSCSCPHRRKRSTPMAELKVMREDFLPPKTPPRRHLISVADLSRDDVERLLATARNFERSLEREVKKLPTLRGRLVLNLFFESSTRTSSSFELAAKRLSADTMSFKASGLGRREGRVAEGHRDHARRLRPGRDRDPARRDRRAAARRALDERARGQRGRRQAPAPDAGAARPLHAPRGVRADRRPARRDRRRRPPLARRTLEHPGARADGRAGHARRPARRSYREV